MPLGKKKNDALTSVVIGLSRSIGHATYNSTLSVFAVSSCIEMGKIILMFFVFLACLYPGTSEKDLPNGLMKYSIDERHIPEQEENSDAKNTQKAKRIQEITSPRVYYASRLFGLSYRSANPEIPQVRKVRFQRPLVYRRLI